MSAHLPNPARDTILDALLAVGVFSDALGVEHSPMLRSSGVALWPFTFPRDNPHPLPLLVTMDQGQALGWTVLAAWIEQGGNPIERSTSRLGTGPLNVGWRVSLAGKTWSRAVATLADHARVAELAAALLVLRRWALPTRPWGLRDLQAEALDKVQREASVRALGPRPRVVMDSPIDPAYLAAHGTASE